MTSFLFTVSCDSSLFWVDLFSSHLVPHFKRYFLSLPFTSKIISLPISLYNWLHNKLFFKVLHLHFNATLVIQSLTFEQEPEWHLSKHEWPQVMLRQHGTWQDWIDKRSVALAEFHLEHSV